MGRYVLQRVAVSAGMLVPLSALVFLLLHLAPGDPIYAYISPGAAVSPNQLAELRKQLGLDQPLPMQYVGWLGTVLRGNLGYSTVDFTPVARLARQRLGPTLLLMGSGIGIAAVIGIVTGIITAVKRNTPLDYLLAVLAFLGISTPAFLAALVGLYAFSVQLHWFPSGGFSTPGRPQSAGDVVYHLALPALILSGYYTATVMRYTRAALLEVMGLDYVRTARAKGLRAQVVIVKHVLHNALMPVITVIGASIGTAVGGAVFIESVFGWPGMGLLFINAVDARNYPVIMAITLIVGVGVLLANLLTDLAYAAADPRIRYT